MAAVTGYLNFLDGLDHFVKRELKIPGYERYMDDFVLFDNDKARLLDARAAIAAASYSAVTSTAFPSTSKRISPRSAMQSSRGASSSG